MTEIVDHHDTERLARRRAIRSEAAKLQFEKDKIPVLEATLADSHQRVEVATDAHTATCAPLQLELSTLESEAVARIGRREPPDETADGRRAELLREITDENGRLETIVEAEKVCRAPTEREVWKLRNEVLDPKAVLSRLGQPALASPSLLLAAHCASQATRFASARREHARRSLKLHEANVGGLRCGQITGNLTAELFHVSKWEAEVAAAGAAVGEAIAEGQRIHKAILAE